jgi:hypothetical protein
MAHQLLLDQRAVLGQPLQQLRLLPELHVGLAHGGPQLIDNVCHL